MFFLYAIESPGAGHQRWYAPRNLSQMLLRNLRRRALAHALVAVVLSAPGVATAASWEATVSPLAPGSFPELRPVQTTYRFGWNGIAAGRGEIRLKKSAGGFLFDASGGTTGLARKLWKYDVRHTARSDAQTLRPIEVREIEEVRSKKFSTRLSFGPQGVVSERQEQEDGAVKSKTRRFGFPDTLSLNSALLFLRTQPLNNDAVHRIVVYPSTSAYLATITVREREPITGPTGTYHAIKADLQLTKIGKKRELKPHKAFRSATIWLSDDTDRLVLRIETEVFIGTVFAELESVQFENPKP